jgi:hypothetical protein
VALRGTDGFVEDRSRHKAGAEVSEERLCLADRIGLRIEEAAAALGLSERAFRDHILPRCPKMYAGRSIVIPKRLFEQFIETLALEEQGQIQETAAELLARTEQASR